MMEPGRHVGTNKRSPEQEKRKEIPDYTWQLTGLFVITCMKDPLGNIKGNIFEGDGYTSKIYGNSNH